jgi:hypothetical protein
VTFGRLAKLALAALLTAAVVAAPAAQSRLASNSVTYPESDTSQEDPANADITGVTVSNDNVGNLTFKVAIANQPSLTSFGVDIFIDTDDNALTGPNFRGAGAEDFFRLAGQNGGTFVWNGTQLAPKTIDSYSANYSGGVATFSVNTRDLGNTRQFSFTVETLTIVPNPPGVTDFAPEDAGSGPYSFDVKGVKTLTAGTLRISPRPAKANRLLTVSLPVEDNETGAPLESGRVICRATIGPRPVSGGSTLGGGVATCRFNIPKSAKGKTIRGTLTVDAKETVVRKSFSSRIR